MSRCLLRSPSLAPTLLLLVAALNASAAPITNGGPGGFESTQSASSLALWLNAATIGQGDSTAVSAWSDSSFYGRHAAQATGANQPTYRTGITGLPNDQPVVRFAASPSQQFLDLIPAANNMLRDVSGTTMYGVFSTSATSLQRYFFVSSGLAGSNAGQTRAGLNLFDTGSGNIVGGTSGPARFEVAGRRLDTNSFQRIVGGTITTNTFYVHEGILNYATASGSVTVDGTTVATASGTFQTPGNSEDTDSLRIRVGANASNTPQEFFRGDLAEVVVFDRVLNGAERIVVENHLAAKYDRPLNPAVDFYSGKTGANGDYDFDVFGVGRLNAGTQVTTAGMAGFGIESTSLGDGDWIFAGHDGTPVGTTNAGLANPDDSRWSRAWFVDVTGVLDATLAFDFSDAGLSFDPTFDRLLFSSDGVNFSDLSLAGTLSGDQLSFFVASLESGFYTLGAPFVPEPGTGALLGIGLLAAGGARRKRRAGSRQG